MRGMPTQYQEDDRDPPCEKNCPINAVELLPENDQAIDLYIRSRPGTDTVFRMMDLAMTMLEAENLLEKLAMIAGVIAEWKAEQQKAGT